MTNWIKVMNSLPAHPKILRVGDRAAWLYVCGLCYSNEHLTDGYIPREVLAVAAPGVKSPEKLAQALVDISLWDLADGGWQVHDYGDYQRTSTQVKETRRKDRERKTPTESDDTLHADSERNPDGIRAESNGTPNGASRTTRANPAQEEKREEKNPPTPLSLEAEEWLLHYERTTGHGLPARSTKAFKAIVTAYEARRGEGHQPDDLKLATVGAHADEYRREHGYDTADSILKPTKVASLIAKGKLRTGGAQRPLSSVELAQQFRGPAA